MLEQLVDDTLHKYNDDYSKLGNKTEETLKLKNREWNDI